MNAEGIALIEVATEVLTRDVSDILWMASRLALDDVRG
jgi:hypothetical protein